MSLIFLPCMAGATAAAWRMAWNPNDKGSDVTLSNTNLTALYDGAGNNARVRGFRAHETTGKFYFEVVADAIFANTNTPEVGLLPAGDTLNDQKWNEFTSDNGIGFFPQTSGGGSIYKTDCNTGGIVATGISWANGVVFMVAADFAADKIWIGLDGLWLASGDPAAGTNPAFSGSMAGRGPLYPAVYVGSGPAQATAHFAAEDFTYTPPTGFIPW